MRIAYKGVLYKVLGFQQMGKVQFVLCWTEHDPDNIEWIPIDDPDMFII